MYLFSPRLRKCLIFLRIKVDWSVTHAGFLLNLSPSKITPRSVSASGEKGIYCYVELSARRTNSLHRGDPAMLYSRVMLLSEWVFGELYHLIFLHYNDSGYQSCGHHSVGGRGRRGLPFRRPKAEVKVL